jgi:quercetin dioxygenase-like cupin family protein
VDEVKALYGTREHLVDMITVQAGAVVSRTLVDRPTGTVTLFAFDAGQKLSEHTAPFDALVHVLAGKVAIVLAGVRHDLTPGDAIIMPGGVPHAVDAIEPCTWLLTMIRS